MRLSTACANKKRFQPTAMAYNTAFAIALGLTCWILLTSHDLTPTFRTAMGLFSIILATTTVTLILVRQSLRKRRPDLLCRWLEKHHPDWLHEVAEPSLPWSIFLQVSLYQLLIFAFDTATLHVILNSMHSNTTWHDDFVCVVVAQSVGSIGMSPGGLGTFEATCVAVLRSHEIPLEAALAATLTLRAFTFWLPMLPGFWAARSTFRN
ncbi:MAG: lysylphosphatidylglycerol synthase transmembrane domain-containing protein [Pirellulaceae bacterium]